MIAQVFAHVGLWLPLTVIVCVISVGEIRDRTNP